MTPTIKDQLSRISHQPGVYQYYDRAGNLLYVGKAKDLYKRVTSYWNANKVTANHAPWNRLMVKDIVRIQVVEVKTELEALMLENSLVKSLRPFYNIRLKDDKTFPFIRVSHELLPRFTITRKIKKDKAHYLGPFFSVTALRSMLKILQQLYGIKITASDLAYEARSNVPSQIGLGARNLDNRDKYLHNVEAAIQFLSSPQPTMEKILKRTMAQAADNNQFERAAIFRDKLLAIQQLRHKQSLFSVNTKQFDYVGIAQTGKLIMAYVLFEREGKIVNHKHFLFEHPGKLTPAEVSQFVLEYLYINGLSLPHKIAVTYMPNGYKGLASLLSRRVGHRVSIFVPKRGEVKKRLTTAVANADYQLKLEALKKHRREHGLANLAQNLGLKKIPKRIEAFDISNLGPTNIVGASVVFINGQPAKSQYRKYKINLGKVNYCSSEVRSSMAKSSHVDRTVKTTQDDFASMRELVFRRVVNKDRPKPDLLLIDGGKGQLSAALDALKLGKIKIPVVALAKKEEVLFFESLGNARDKLKSGSPSDRFDSLTLPHDSEALLLLMAIRDEVHRFGLSFHRHRRSKALLS